MFSSKLVSRSLQSVMASIRSSTASVTSESESLSDFAPSSAGSTLYDGTPSISSPVTESGDYFLDAKEDHFILVVGGLGYIGSHTTWELLKSGKNVVVIDDLSNSSHATLQALWSLRDEYFQDVKCPPALDFYKLDYRDSTQLRTILTVYEDFSPAYSSSISPLRSRITGVIHFAAFKAVEESFKRPLAYYSNNVSGLIDFCSLLAEFKIQNFVFSSSATVYGELANKGGRLLEEQCDSSGCIGLTNPYGRTKWMCEAILSDLAYSDPAWTITALRYFNPIGCDSSGLLGEDPHAAASNLMPKVINAMTGKLPVLSIFGTDWPTEDGTAIRDFIHVSDLAQGHLAAIRAMDNNRDSGFHVYNLGTGTGHSVREIINAMQHVSGQAIPVIEAARRPGDVGICIAEPTKSASALGWRTQRSLRDACADICRRLKSA